MGAVKALLQRIGGGSAAGPFDRRHPLTDLFIDRDELLERAEPALLPALALQPQPLVESLAVANTQPVKQRSTIRRAGALKLLTGDLRCGAGTGGAQCVLKLVQVDRDARQRLSGQRVALGADGHGWQRRP